MRSAATHRQVGELRKAIWLAGLSALVVIGVAPNPLELGSNNRWIAAAVTPSLGVPSYAVLFGIPDAALSPGDRILGVQSAPGRPMVNPGARQELYEILNADARPSEVRLAIRRGAGRLEVAVPIVTEPASARIARSLPLLLAALTFIAVACSALVGGRHPCAAPLASMFGLAGLAALASFDSLLPGDTGLLGIAELRGRLSLLLVQLVPAGVVHFAMRYPIVHPRFRGRAVAAAPYAVFAIPAVVGQLRYEDVALLQGLTRLAEVVAVLALSIVAATSLRFRSSLKPIERARAGAVVAGSTLATIPVLALLLADRQPSVTASGALSAMLVAMPLSTTWAVVRYRLLDPPRWLRETLFSALLASGAVAGSMALAELLFGRALDQVGSQVYVLATTVGALGLYELVRRAWRILGWPRIAPDFDGLLAEAIVDLGRARSPDQAVEVVRSIIARYLEPAATEVAAVGDAATPLGVRGEELWRSSSPAPSPILLGPREEDPSSDQPEFVMVFRGLSDRTLLLHASARADAVPCSVDEIHHLEVLAELAVVALVQTEARSGLEVLVDRRTESLRTSFDQRAATLEAARAIQAANDLTSVKRAVDDFAVRLGCQVAWHPSSWVSEGDLPEGESPTGGSGFAAPTTSDGAGGRELREQLDTVCAFANLAVDRIQLLSDLRAEIHRQSAELAELQSRRHRAEFVRGVAHELRKPNDEVQRIARDLIEFPSGSRVERLERLSAVTSEMNRRIDLLLVHSELHLDQRRFDIVSLSEDALQRVSSVHPGRKYGSIHALNRLPILGDPTRMLSVLENLLDNAARATAPSGRVLLRTRPAYELDSPGCAGRVCVEVEDDGCGVSSDTIESIFEPGVSHFPGGFGLGLALVREIVLAHGGSVEAASGNGRTLFRVVLPQFSEDIGGPAE